jgi:Amidohydrolase
MQRWRWREVGERTERNGRRVMVESDYPHQGSTWPATQTLLRSDLGHLDPETVRKLAYGNATHLYRWPAPPAEWLDRSVMGAG